MLTHRLWIAALTMALWGMGTSDAPLARAQDKIAALFPLRSEHPVEPKDLATIEQSIKDTLRKRGYRVIPAETARTRKDKTEPCERGECVKRLLTELGAALLIRNRLWTRADEAGQARPHNFSVGLYDAHGAYAEGAAEIGTGDLSRATATALDHAFDALLAVQADLSLRVDGTPVGASVLVDGRAVGDVPWEGKLLPGRHRVRVEMQGYRAEGRVVDASTDSHRYSMTVHLKPWGASGSDSQDRSASSPSPWNYVIAGGFLLPAAWGITSFVRTAVDDGQCSGDVDDSGLCDARGNMDYRAYLALGAGVASLGGALFFLLAKPLPIEPDIRPQAHHYGLKITGEF
ncbi:MAG: PEGA domain-containing protein [Myxococcales bacterium]|nr:PEGA domain-containing protein [Myxococcales bacterium]MCB9708510.1 PEGA domain-containing protein [Myxococcales bacterium]